MNSRELLQRALDMLLSSQVSHALIWPRYDLCEAIRAHLGKEPEPERIDWKKHDANKKIDLGRYAGTYGGYRKEDM